MMITVGGIALAILGWFFTFGLPVGNFWVKIGITVVVVCSYSFLWQRPRIKVSAGSIALGVVSAAVLYAFFWIGNAAAPYIVP